MSQPPEEIIMAISPDSYIVLYAILWLAAVVVGIGAYLVSQHLLALQRPGERAGWTARWISALAAAALATPFIWYAHVFCSEQFCVMKVDGPEIVLQFEIPPREFRAGWGSCRFSLERGMLFGRRWCRIVVHAPPNDYHYGHLIVCEEAEEALRRFETITGTPWKDLR